MKQIAALIVTLLAFGWCTSTALAQPAAEPETDTLLAEEFTRAALTILGLPQTENNDHTMALATTLLDQAVALDPGNPHIWTFRMDLAQQMGDAEAHEKALVGYLATGVDDERAQYELIRINLAKHQTLDEQFDALEQLLNSEGSRRLSDPLRSRLASYAASLAEELVDPQAQARWVVEAARLDPANGEAAHMLHALVVERGGDDLRQATALVNVVRASPMDPWARLEFADALAGQAAYERALQQYQLVDRWIGSSPFVVGDKVFRQLLPTDTYRNWLHTLATTGADPLALQIIEALAGYYDAYHTSRAAAIEQGVDVSQAPEVPETLPLDFEVIRLAVLDGPSDTEAAAASFARIQAGFAAVDQQGETAGRLALLAAVFGPDLDQALALAQALNDDDPDKATALGWVAARQGNTQEAIDLLAPLAESDALASCGLALVEDLDDAGRARRLQEIIHRGPLDLAALAAGRRLSRDGRDIPPTRVGSALIERMSKFPESLWLADLERTPWLDARLRIRPARFDHLDPINAEITVWNTSRFPIAIGDGEVIRPRAILQVTANAGGQPVPPMSPIVIDIGRKLTLGPGERLIIDTRLDYHQFGALRALNPGVGILFDTRLIINPAVGPSGTFIPAATGGVSTVRDCIAQGTPPNAELINQWIDGIDTAQAQTRFATITRLLALDRETLPDLVTIELEARLRGAVTQQLGRWDEETQAWAMMFLRRGADSNSTYGTIAMDHVKDSDSEMVWLAFLARQVKTADAEMLREAIGRQDLAQVARFAETFRRALRDSETAIAEQQRAFEEQQRQFEEQQQQQQGGQR
ncbi:MAG: tetratricopeptide repeat protein [Phycisphaerales bacterium JB063]